MSIVNNTKLVGHQRGKIHTDRTAILRRIQARNTTPVCCEFIGGGVIRHAISPPRRANSISSNRQLALQVDASSDVVKVVKFDHRASEGERNS